MKKYFSFFSTALFFILLIAPGTLDAQKDFPHDSSYYVTFPHKWMGRVFASQKYVHLNFPAKGDADDMEYKANAKMNMGLGVTIHNFSLNLFYGFSFLNKKDDEKGKTKGLDLQVHVYPRKWAIDLYGVFPKGFYIDPKGFATNANSYYYRPDIKFSLMGLSAYKVPNKYKFSYRASIIQNEWQKKSAGSLLFGGQAYYGSAKGDSALVPKVVQSLFSQAGVTKLNFFSVGPGIGYAYTLVIDKHFFITGSIVGSINLTFTNEEATSKNNKTSINAGEVFKTAIGYNSDTWSFAATWLGNGVWFKGVASSENYFWPTGNIRISVARKFFRNSNH